MNIVAIFWIGTAVCGIIAIVAAVFLQKAITTASTCVGAVLWYIPVFILSNGEMNGQRLCLIMATFAGYSILTLVASTIGSRKKESISLSIVYLAGIVGVTVGLPFTAILALTLLRG